MASVSFPSGVFAAGNKFGMGLRPGEAAVIADDPKGWLHTQVPVAATLPLAFATLPPSSVLLAAATELLKETRAVSESGTGLSASAAAVQRKRLLELRRESREQVAALQALRLQQAIATRTPFAERLVRFWSNHFTVAVGGGTKRALAHFTLAYENEAIRLNLGGSFADLALAVTRHPAMLLYLDNAVSVGPNSPVGKRRGLGLNENYARELLELHTLGVDGGYTQQDVTSLARILTGWTVVQDERQAKLLTGAAVEPGSFSFVASMHEPGAQKLLGKTWRTPGEARGESAVRYLASHPATARHLATKLARHFVADAPPPAAIDTLERVFLDTDGDLPSLHAALVDLGVAWDASQRKFKTPEEFVISAGRALGLQDAAALLPILETFGQVPFTAPSPAGWPDTAEAWSGPDALLKRIEWANALAQRLPATHDARELASQLLPPDALLQQEVSRAESSMQALALLLASPAFQWR